MLAYEEKVSKYKSEKILTKLAKFISNVTYSPVLSIPIFIIINYFILNLHDFIVVTTVSIVFSALLPMTFILLWARKKNTSVDMPKKEDRNYPFLFGIISYIIGTVILYSISAPALTIMLMFCSF